MRIAIELSGEHPTLPRAEATAVLEALGAAVEPQVDDRVVVAELPAGRIGRLGGRLGLAHRIIELAATAPVDPGAITEAGAGIDLGGRSFAVRASRLIEGQPRELPIQIQQRLGKVLSEQATVDLDTPEVEVRVLLGEQAWIGPELARIDRPSFEARHVEARPHFSPISLHPRLARALVNLTGFAPDERVWDPFCGTGGLVLEAALAGAEAIASDLAPDMIEGTRAALDAFGGEAELIIGDIEEVASQLSPVHGVVTDPPYGRASSTHREDVRTLYERFFRAATSVVEPGGRVVIVLPDPDDAELAPPSLELIDRHDWYVHKSLTRHIHVFRR